MIDGETVLPGQILTYEIKYTNSTDKDETVTFMDKIPANTTYVENSASEGGVYTEGEDGNIVSWTDIVIAAGTSVTVSFQVKVDEIVSGEIITNEAIVRKGDNEYTSNPVSNPTPPAKKVFDEGDTTTSIDGEEVQPDQNLVYEITYTNGTDKPVDVTITDEIPELTKYIEDSADEDGVYDAEGNVITWMFKDVAAGETVTVHFTVKVDSSVAGEDILNEANVQAGENNFKTNEITNPTPELGKMQIIKTLLDFVDDEAPTFVFSVEAVYKGKVVYSNVHSMSFDTYGTKTITIENLPVGAEVTVTEVYSGARYEAVSASTATTTILPDDAIVNVQFTNRGNNFFPGHGILNEFIYGDRREWELEGGEGKASGADEDRVPLE